MAGTQDLQPGVEDLAVPGLGVGGAALRRDHAGDLVAGGQGLGVVGSQNPQSGVEDPAEAGLGLGAPHRLSCALAGMPAASALPVISGQPAAALQSGLRRLQCHRTQLLGLIERIFRDYRSHR